MTMNRIEKKDLEVIDVHSLSDVMSKALWVIEYLSTESNESFGATQIAQYMTQNLGVSTSKQAVHMALSKAASKKFCHKAKMGFSIMKKGQEELMQQSQKEKVILIEPGKPFEAGMKVENIFSEAEGALKISDPYLDVKSLDVLYRSNLGIPIKILTVQIKNEPVFKREVQKLQQQGVDLEIRKTTQGVLHDRYFIDKNHFWLSGNSLNNLGKKESFIVVLGKDLRDTVNSTFNSRWQAATAI